MLSKTRTTIIALVAAFSFAATTVPAADARPNNNPKPLLDCVLPDGTIVPNGSTYSHTSYGYTTKYTCINGNFCRDRGPVGGASVASECVWTGSGGGVIARQDNSPTPRSPTRAP